LSGLLLEGGDNVSLKKFCAGRQGYGVGLGGKECGGRGLKEGDCLGDGAKRCCTEDRDEGLDCRYCGSYGWVGGDEAVVVGDYVEGGG